MWFIKSLGRIYSLGSSTIVTIIILVSLTWYFFHISSAVTINVEYDKIPNQAEPDLRLYNRVRIENDKLRELYFSQDIEEVKEDYGIYQ